MILGRLMFLAPMAFAIIGLVLSALCLFAGHEKGFMEDYAVARLNTSMIGQNMFDITGDDENKEEEEEEDDDGDGGFFDTIKDIGDDVKDTFNDVAETIEDKVNDITGSIANELAETIGIKEWYSLHIMSGCEGNYEPEVTADNPDLNVTKCTTSRPTHRLNLTRVLDQELGVGPFDLNLADIEWPEEIQEKIDLINDLIVALFSFYVVAMGFSGLALIGSAVAILLPQRNIVNFANVIFAGLAALALIIGASIATAAGTKGVKAVNKVADKFGVQAERGNPFLILNWVATGFMILATVFWTWRVFAVRKQRKYTVRKEKSPY